MKFDSMKWEYPVNLRTALEEIDENRDGTTVAFDALPGTYIGAPLKGIVTVVEVPHPGAAPLWGIEVMTETDEGHRIFNTFFGLDQVPAVGTEVAQGGRLGVVGVGIVGGWDVEWTAYLNFADDSDQGGNEINPLNLADEMGGIVFRDPEKRLPVPVKPEPLPAEPVFEAPPATDNKKLIMLGLAGLAAWYFMKKGSK